MRSRGSHMDIDIEKQEEMVPSPPHPPTVQRDTVEPIDPVITPRNSLGLQAKDAW